MWEPLRPVTNLATTRSATTRVLYATLLIYAGIAGTYAVVNSISTIIGNFNLRDQVQAPFGLYGNLIENSAAAATHAGIRKGDTILAINGLPKKPEYFSIPDRRCKKSIRPCSRCVSSINCGKRFCAVM